MPLGFNGDLEALQCLLLGIQKGSRRVCPSSPRSLARDGGWETVSDLRVDSLPSPGPAREWREKKLGWQKAEGRCSAFPFEN